MSFHFGLLDRYEFISGSLKLWHCKIYLISSRPLNFLNYFLFQFRHPEGSSNLYPWTYCQIHPPRMLLTLHISRHATPAVEYPRRRSSFLQYRVQPHLTDSVRSPPSLDCKRAEFAVGVYGKWKWRFCCCEILVQRFSIFFCVWTQSSSTQKVCKTIAVAC